jgi:molecular chaperone GrpE
MTQREDDDISIEDMALEGSEEDVDVAEDRIDAKLKKVKDELDKARKEKQEYLDGWQRAKADYVNALKRFEEERKSAVMLGRTASLVVFLPAMDSLERAEQAGEIPPAFSGIAKQLHEAVKSLGLAKFGAPGEEFDPNFHEALGQELASTIEEDNKIIEVYETGWKTAEAVIRPAKVRVSHFEG